MRYHIPAHSVSLDAPDVHIFHQALPKTLIRSSDSRTLIGFLRRMKKLSALCSKNRVNLWTRIFSISSACLILMLMRTELTEGSIRTRSFSLRATVRGVSRTSGELRASISLSGHTAVSLGMPWNFWCRTLTEHYAFPKSEKQSWIE